MSFAASEKIAGSRRDEVVSESVSAFRTSVLETFELPGPSRAGAVYKSKLRGVSMSLCSSLII